MPKNLAQSNQAKAKLKRRDYNSDQLDDEVAEPAVPGVQAVQQFLSSRRNSGFSEGTVPYEGEGAIGELTPQREGSYANLLESELKEKILGIDKNLEANSFESATSFFRAMTANEFEILKNSNIEESSRSNEKGYYGLSNGIRYVYENYFKEDNSHLVEFYVKGFGGGEEKSSFLNLLREKVESNIKEGKNITEGERGKIDIGLNVKAENRAVSIGLGPKGTQISIKNIPIKKSQQINKSVHNHLARALKNLIDENKVGYQLIATHSTHENKPMNFKNLGGKAKRSAKGPEASGSARL
ncbi:hypothetical protein [Mycetohabitans rhizoxinica]|uniref:Uncharacterized protein n=1 Tax=Mycetohabitans rhizoxinica TaxID=412963 RepID=A0ABZ2Q016_9BURK